MEELTVQEAARRKGVTASAVHSAIRTGRLKARVALPSGSARGTWRIRAQDLEDWTPVRDPAQRARRSAPRPEDAEAARRALIRAATGSMAGGGVTLADFLREKREDLVREEYHGPDAS